MKVCSEQMRHPSVFEVSTSRRRSRASSATIGAVALATVFALSLATDAALGASPISTFCPSASVVNTVLGQKNKAPVSTVEPFGKTCTYHGSGAVSTTIAFQKDTAASFADGEKAAAILGIVKVPGLGQAAWATKAGGSLYILDEGESIKIFSPLTSTKQLEALAHKLL